MSTLVEGRKEHTKGWFWIRPLVRRWADGARPRRPQYDGIPGPSDSSPTKHQKASMDIMWTWNGLL